MNISWLRAGKAAPIERLKIDHGSVAVYSAEEVLDAAAHGNVVLRGWGAPPCCGRSRMCRASASCGRSRNVLSG